METNGSIPAFFFFSTSTTCEVPTIVESTVCNTILDVCIKPVTLYTFKPSKALHTMEKNVGIIIPPPQTTLIQL